MSVNQTGSSRREVMRIAASGGAALALSLRSVTADAASTGTPPTRKIMIVRHAEKPDDAGAPPGIGADGEHDRHALLVRGWQRAGALVRFFAPRDGRFQHPGLARPAAIIAAAPSPAHKSERSVLTVGPLAALLEVEIDARFGPDDVAAAAAAAASSGARPVLLAWEHKRIADLVVAVTGGTVVPPHWPGTRFDMVLVLDRDEAGWRLGQVPQLLLAGDSDTLLDAG